MRGIFNRPSPTWSAGGRWLDVRPHSGEISAWQDLWPRHLRYEGGLAASINRGGALSEQHPDFSGAIEISGTADEESGGIMVAVAYLDKQHGHFNPDRVQST